jgi:hypothetical protein
LLSILKLFNYTIEATRRTLQKDSVPILNRVQIWVTGARSGTGSNTHETTGKIWVIGCVMAHPQRQQSALLKIINDDAVNLLLHFHSPLFLTPPFSSTESEPCPLLSLNSNNQILVHTGLDNAPSSGTFPHSERSLLLQKWTHMAVEVFGHTLRLVLDGRVEVETEVGYALPWRLNKV